MAANQDITEEIDLHEKIDQIAEQLADQALKEALQVETPPTKVVVDSKPAVINPQNIDLEYILKQITFQGRRVKVITQNQNGPCPFIALMNVLLLRNDIYIPEQTSKLNFSNLTDILGEYLLTQASKVIFRNLEF